MIKINFDKAVVITKDRLRAERAPLLSKLDVDYMKAIEQGTDVAPIVAEKQRLRDITKVADQAQSLDELKAITASDAPSQS
jgi:hypothetical protein